MIAHSLFDIFANAGQLRQKLAMTHLHSPTALRQISGLTRRKRPKFVSMNNHGKAADIHTGVSTVRLFAKVTGAFRWHAVCVG